MRQSASLQVRSGQPARPNLRAGVASASRFLRYALRVGRAALVVAVIALTVALSSDLIRLGRTSHSTTYPRLPVNAGRASRLTAMRTAADRSKVATSLTVRQRSARTPASRAN